MPKISPSSPPIPTTSIDPYFMKGGLQPFTADDMSNDESGGLEYLGILVGGGVRREKEKLEEVRE